jgi:hypothetical protein
MATSYDNQAGLGRILPRHAFEARIRIRVQRQGQEVTLPAWARDLSETGLGGFVAEKVNAGELVTIEMPLTDSDRQAIPAKVIRTVGTEVGLQFTALSASQRRLIQTTLQGCPAMPYAGNLP